MANMICPVYDAVRNEMVYWNGARYQKISMAPPPIPAGPDYSRVMMLANSATNATFWPFGDLAETTTLTGTAVIAPADGYVIITLDDQRPYRSLSSVWSIHLKINSVSFSLLVTPSLIKSAAVSFPVSSGATLECVIRRHQGAEIITIPKTTSDSANYSALRLCPSL